MTKKIILISTSPRKGGNSDRLADEFIRGAKEANHCIEKINLYDKTINFCKGCLACQQAKTGHCVVRDDADAIVKKMAEAEVIVFATPIYFYEMCGQMKTLLDRTNPLFPIAHSFKAVYFITTAAESERSAMDGAIKGLQGWIDCFDEVKLQGVIYGTDLMDTNAVLNHPTHLQDAYNMGKDI